MNDIFYLVFVNAQAIQCAMLCVNEWLKKKQEKKCQLGKCVQQMDFKWFFRRPLDENRAILLQHLECVWLFYMS